MLVLVILVVGETNLRLGCNPGGNRGGRSWLARLKAVEEVCKVAEEVCKVIMAGLPKHVYVSDAVHADICMHQ